MKFYFFCFITVILGFYSCHFSFDNEARFDDCDTSYLQSNETLKTYYCLKDSLLNTITISMQNGDTVEKRRFLSKKLIENTLYQKNQIKQINLLN